MERNPIPFLGGNEAVRKRHTRDKRDKRVAIHCLCKRDNRVVSMHEREESSYTVTCYSVYSIGLAKSPTDKSPICKMPEGCRAKMVQRLSKKIATKMQGICLAKSFASRKRRSAEASRRIKSPQPSRRIKSAEASGRPLSAPALLRK